MSAIAFLLLSGPLQEPSLRAAAASAENTVMWDTGFAWFRWSWGQAIIEA